MTHALGSSPSPLDAVSSDRGDTAGQQVMTADDVRRALQRISHEIVERCAGRVPVLVGIHTRGVPLAHRLASAIGGIEPEIPRVGALDIGMYRDDLDARPRTRLGKTEMPVELDEHSVVLVDDVLFTGRTIRAALDALADIGRARTVQLAALVDRGHRELPIRADYVGKNLPTGLDQRVTVRLVETDGEDGVWIET